jgi:16S rRNA (guanine966-N2)-methyltransferase
MRVIGGNLRGRKLCPVRGKNIRPTADRLRESIFNILSNLVRDAWVLDLFAGTGSQGIEALSRGATAAVFIDSNPDAISIIERNLKICRLDDQSRVIRWDIARNLNCLGPPERPFGLLFLDPPYSKGLVRPTLAHLHRRNLCEQNACLVVEHALSEPIPDDLTGFRMEEQRKHGKTLVSFLSPVL